MKSRQVDQIPPHPSHLVSNSPPQQQALMSNSRPPGHVNESNARGMPGGWMLMSLFDRYIIRAFLSISRKPLVLLPFRKSLLSGHPL